MNKSGHATQPARAERLAQDLDRLIQRQQPDPGQTVAEDRKLLELFDSLYKQAPFAPTPAEQAQLRRRFDQLTANRGTTMQNTFPKILKPALQAVFWSILLIGVIAISTVLVTSLLGKPVQPGTGPAVATEMPTAPAPTADTQAALPTQTPQPAFPAQVQTVNGLELELRDLATIGGSLRATLCYPPPDNRDWRIEDVELKAGNEVLPVYPNSSAQPEPGEDGLVCETYTAAAPVSADGRWTVTVRRLIGPRNAIPTCEQVNQQLAVEYPGLTVTCDTTDSGFGFSTDKIPEGMDDYDAHRMVQTFITYDARSGPWTFPVSAADVVPLVPESSPANLVVIPAACDPNINQLEDGQHAPIMDYQSHLSGVAGTGTAQSGDFTFQMSLACDTHISRLMTGGDYRSEINGLGVYWKVTYQGEPVDNKVMFYSGFNPFVKFSSGSGGLTNNESHVTYAGIAFPENIRPDFTQSDVRLRYVVKVQTTDGTPSGEIQGAALSFTLQREPEGYRPVDVKVEPLSETERQTTEDDPSAPLPFPTLPAPDNETSAETQALLDLLDHWQQPLLDAPGWVHQRTRTEMPGGNDLYGGLTEYFSDHWFQIDEQSQVITHIQIDTGPDGTALQKVYSMEDKTVNLTFGQTFDGFQPYPLDLAYSVRNALKAGDQLERTETALNGQPVILLVVHGAYTRREAMDAASGAWLFSETVEIQAGADPLTDVSLVDRTTVEATERVEAPPAEVLALLGSDFGGYTPLPPSGTPAPQGFDPTHSKITMQVIPGDDFNAPSIWYGDLYAEDYLLGRVDFGGVVGGWCARSPDGAKVAFSYQETIDGNLSRSTLRIFDVRSVQNITAPAPDMLLSSFTTWSPDGTQVAFSACRRDQQYCGLYLYDVNANQTRLLVEGVVGGNEALFKPDGKEIAFQGGKDGKAYFFVAEVSSGKVIYQAEVDQQTYAVPAGAPIESWGVTMPRERKHCFDNR